MRYKGKYNSDEKNKKTKQKTNIQEASGESSGSLHDAFQLSFL
jgi:hypothetical protein